MAIPAADQHAGTAGVPGGTGRGQRLCGTGVPAGCGEQLPGADSPTVNGPNECVGATAKTRPGRGHTSPARPDTIRSAPATSAGSCVPPEAMWTPRAQLSTKNSRSPVAIKTFAERSSASVFAATWRQPTPVRTSARPHAHAPHLRRLESALQRTRLHHLGIERGVLVQGMGGIGRHHIRKRRVLMKRVGNSGRCRAWKPLGHTAGSATAVHRRAREDGSAAINKIALRAHIAASASRSRKSPQPPKGRVNQSRSCIR